MFTEERPDGLYLVDKNFGIENKLNLTEEENARFILIRNSMQNAYQNRTKENVKVALDNARLIFDPNGVINTNIVMFLKHNNIHLSWKNTTSQTFSTRYMTLRLKEFAVTIGISSVD